MKLSISKGVHLVEPGDFEPADHWYARALNSNLHPLVSFFLNLNNQQIAERFIRLHPDVHPESLDRILNYHPKIFKWAGTDLIHVATNQGRQRGMIVIETNSCPSGQKSMPLPDYNIENGGYYKLIRETFFPMVQGHRETGALALIYDKNPMENVGYAAAMADVFQEPVYLAEYKSSDSDSVRFFNNQLHIVNENGAWTPIRAAFRYVTQHPWDRIPTNSRTLLLNPIEACLAGGRNKSVAFDAYQKFNHEFKQDGLQIFLPATYTQVSWEELPQFYQLLDGHMVIKVPDSNAGQGVYTITSDRELEKVLKILEPFTHDKYLVQQLILSQPLKDSANAIYHVGTLPDIKGRYYAFDARMMLHDTADGLRPLAVYSRRSQHPLNETLPEGMDSWEVYGTNLSVKSTEGWTYDDVRLMLYDVKNFGILGLGLDELIDGFVQSCSAVYAIDQHAVEIFNL
jgi:hypothetical protein